MDILGEIIIEFIAEVLVNVIFELIFQFFVFLFDHLGALLIWISALIWLDYQNVRRPITFGQVRTGYFPGHGTKKKNLKRIQSLSRTLGVFGFLALVSSVIGVFILIPT